MKLSLNTQAVSDRTKKPSTAVVTIAIGDAYLRLYNANFRKSQQRFAESIDAPLIVITERPHPSPRHPSWHKLMMFRNPEVAKFERIIFLDADIYVNKGSRNPLDLVPERGWGACKNNPYENKRLTREERAICAKRGMPADKMFVMNMGFFTVCQSSHRALMEEIFEREPEQNNWEQNPLSCALLSLENGTILPSYFNTIAVTYREAFGKGLLTAIKLARESGFVHFCGGFSRGNKAVLAVVKLVDTLRRNR